VDGAVLTYPSAYRALADMILPAVEAQSLPGWRTLGAVMASTGIICYVGTRAL
jgi:hypothetical protein